MKSLFLVFFLAVFFIHFSFCQQARDNIYSEVVLYQKRNALEKDLRERVIAKTFSTPLDSNSEYKYENACEAVCQFQFATSEIRHGFDSLFRHYDSLEYETKKSFLEAVYAVYPKDYSKDIQQILVKENNAKLFTLCAVYLFRQDSSIDNGNKLKIGLVEKFPGYDTVSILQ